MLNNVDNIVLQGLYNVKLLARLDYLGLIKSDYFKSLGIEVELKDIFSEIGLGNRAMILSFLYTLLVVPRELFDETSTITTEIRNLNNEIEKIKLPETNTTYKRDNLQIDYVRHIRNSVAHANAEFFECDKVIFYDECKKNEKCEIHIPLNKIHYIIEELDKILTNYNNIKSQEEQNAKQ